jgi:hypothetical protein
MIQVVEVADIVLREMAGWYKEHNGKTETIRAKRPTVQRLVECDVRVFEVAFKLACEDMRRMTVDQNGAIIVWNRPAW